MKILLIEAFFTGSHKQWAEGYARNSKHDVTILSLSGKYWKWRMHGGAVSLASKFEELNFEPDLILASDMLDLSVFLSLTRKRTSGIPVAVYFHENQLTYPWSPTDGDLAAQRDGHYAFINYTTALSADAVFFNSKFHREEFLKELPNYLKAFPDNRELETVTKIDKKSKVLALGMDLKRFDAIHIDQLNSELPLILWNHRWEYDKNPDSFFNVLKSVKDEGYKFRLAVVGEKFQRVPEAFSEAEKTFQSEIVQFGFCETFAEYASWLHQSAILPVTSNQDFFGGSIIEAMYCGCQPLLPRRLAYPEHIPQDRQGELIYASEGELKQLLKLAIENRGEIGNETKSWISKYDWSQMAPIYDQTFEKVADQVSNRPEN